MPNVKDCPGFETFGADVQQAREAVKMSRREMCIRDRVSHIQIPPGWPACLFFCIPGEIFDKASSVDGAGADFLQRRDMPGRAVAFIGRKLITPVSFTHLIHTFSSFHIHYIFLFFSEKEQFISSFEAEKVTNHTICFSIQEIFCASKMPFFSSFYFCSCYTDI